MSLDELRIGHVTLENQGTGVSVFLMPEGTRGGFYIAGNAPATREINLLDPTATVNQVDALVFSGGSAFGLATAEGVMNYLKEQGRGLKTPHAKVPIVPAACIYDLGIKSAIAPTAEDGYEACKIATVHNQQRGSIGAGTGASVGKLFLSKASFMSGGFGISQINADNGLQVRAYAVVNAVGDIMDATGQIIAGAIKDKHFFNSTHALLKGVKEEIALNKSELNTTLVAVITNADLEKSALTRLAKISSSGMALAISPAFTAYDGDIIFCLSMGDLQADELQISMMMSEAVRKAIVDAVFDSVVL